MRDPYEFNTLQETLVFSLVLRQTETNFIYIFDSEKL